MTEYSDREARSPLLRLPFTPYVIPKYPLIDSTSCVSPKPCHILPRTFISYVFIQKPGNILTHSIDPHSVQHCLNKHIFRSIQPCRTLLVVQMSIDRSMRGYSPVVMGPIWWILCS